jgi:hypothetical protein
MPRWAADADGEGHRDRAKAHGGERDRGARRARERRREADGHRTGQQRQPAEQPVRGVTASGGGRTAGRDRLDRAQPPGPQGWQQGRGSRQAAHRARNDDVHPHRDR